MTRTVKSILRNSKVPRILSSVGRPVATVWQQTLFEVHLDPSILVLELLLLTVGGGRGGGDEQPHTLCGRRLAVVRMFYCSNAQDAVHKRDPALGYSYSDTNALDVIWPWRYPQRALSLRSSSRAKRESGLADECCVKPCYISEILNYC